MSIRTFIFCDTCNPQAIRTINDAEEFGRRCSDGRVWFEGHIHEAVKLGWVMTPMDNNICPNCHKKGLTSSLERVTPNTTKDYSTVLMSV